MGMSENQLADNIQTLRDKCDGLNPEPCDKAFKEVMDFMRQEGPLQKQLTDRDLLKIEGSSLVFSSTLYPSEKSASDK